MFKSITLFSTNPTGFELILYKSAKSARYSAPRYSPQVSRGTIWGSLHLWKQFLVSHHFSLCVSCSPFEAGSLPLNNVPMNNIIDRIRTHSSIYSCKKGVIPSMATSDITKRANNQFHDTKFSNTWTRRDLTIYHNTLCNTRVTNPYNIAVLY